MGFIAFKKHYYLLLILCFGSKLLASNCHTVALEQQYEKLYKSVDAYESVYALALADSLLQVMESSGSAACPLYQQIRYEKGEALELLRKFGDALNLYYDLAREAEQANNWEIAAQTYISIARTYETIQRPDDCWRNLQKASVIIEAHDLGAAFSHFAVRLSSYHRLFDSRDSAKIYASLAIKYGKEYGVERSELDGNLLMGILTDGAASVSYFQEATQIYLRREAFYGASSQKTNIAQRYYDSKNIKQAFIHLDTAYRYALQISEKNPGFYGARLRVYDLKRQFFESLGQIDSAYFYLVQCRETERMIDFRVNQKEVNQKETAFAIEREQAKMLFEKERALMLGRWLIVLMVVLGILAALLINNERKKQFITQQKDLIANKNSELNNSIHRQSLLLSEVHHRVKNNLQLIISLLTLHGHKNPGEKVKVHLDDLSRKVHSIALMHEQLYRSGEFEKIDLKDYFQEIMSFFQAEQFPNKAFCIDLDTNNIKLNLETVLPLGMICTELISNSMKYAMIPSQQLCIQLSVSEGYGQYIFHYLDNGPGYPKGHLERSLDRMGGMLIYSMVRQLQGQSETRNENGAYFEISFREKQVSSV